MTNGLIVNARDMANRRSGRMAIEPPGSPSGESVPAELRVSFMQRKARPTADTSRMNARRMRSCCRPGKAAAGMPEQLDDRNRYPAPHGAAIAGCMINYTKDFIR